MFWLIGLPRHLTSELCKTGVCQKRKASGTHSISFMLFIFPSQQHCSAHTASSSNVPAILLTHWPQLTQSWPKALWFIKRDANQPSPRERSFLHLSPVPPGTSHPASEACGSPWVFSDKSFKKPLQGSLLHPWPKSGLHWHHKGCCEYKCHSVRQQHPPVQWPCQAPLQNNFKGPPQSYILPSDKTRPKMKVPLLPGMPSSTLKPSQKKRERAGLPWHQNSSFKFSSKSGAFHKNEAPKKALCCNSTDIKGAEVGLL